MQTENTQPEINCEECYGAGFHETWEGEGHLVRRVECELCKGGGIALCGWCNKEEATHCESDTENWEGGPVCDKCTGEGARRQLRDEQLRLESRNASTQE